ncbi:hypothetical protein BJ322DRAFT_1091523 [Thelephora terrestris]|uniref:Protein BZZ1 n=1 Tax=Thelephora terrestris TaxID=56493 RepID=A0A9P6H3S5_9AGAM|nr:hypothetical protein BJ322DRAFT_1091523 [Thelephora terrestris]
MATDQSYGQSLPDQVERIANLTDAQLEFLSDVREIYQSRIALEREYSSKLLLLANKAAEKKSRKIAVLVLGEEPTRAWGEADVKNSTLGRAYAQLIDSFSETAQDHVNLADGLDAQVVNVLKLVEKRHEEAKKKQVKAFQKLLSDRERAYGDRVKYDEECLEVETYRQKQDRAHDDKHSGRAAKQYEQQQVDMQNSKNSYIISISIANKSKSKFYDVDLPVLENRLQTGIIEKATKVLSHAQALTSNHLDTLKKRVGVVEQALGNISAEKDQNLFIDFNVRPFVAPADWTFEPCASHYDTPGMVIDPAPKVVLQNRLARCRSKLGELKPVLDSKQRNVQTLEKMLKPQNIGDADDIAFNFIDTVHDLTAHATSEQILLAEIETISEALDGDEGEQRPHDFKSASFSIPTACGYCQASIWGLSKLGKTCKLCGVSVHARCELKIPATCTGSKRVAGGSTLSPSASTISKKSAKSTPNPTPSSFARSEPPPSPEIVRARVVFEYTSTSPYELSISEGETVKVLEEDDGSGWIKVANGSGGKGLVPASYVEAVGAEEKVPNVNPKASAQYVRGMYDYQATGDDEIDIKEGSMIQLTPGPRGGKNYGDGWWEGIDERGKKGIFPSNYVVLA